MWQHRISFSNRTCHLKSFVNTIFVIWNGMGQLACLLPGEKDVTICLQVYGLLAVLDHLYNAPSFIPIFCLPFPTLYFQCLQVMFNTIQPSRTILLLPSIFVNVTLRHGQTPPLSIEVSQPTNPWGFNYFNYIRVTTNLMQFIIVSNAPFAIFTPGTKIFLNILNLFPCIFVKAQFSEPQVTTGLKSVLYNLIFVWGLRYWEVNCFLSSKYSLLPSVNLCQSCHREPRKLSVTLPGHLWRKEFITLT